MSNKKLIVVVHASGAPIVLSAESLREFLKRYSDMLERVAPRECVEDHEYSECVWCRKETEHNDFSLRKKHNHESDCPWVEARRLLGDNLED